MTPPQQSSVAVVGGGYAGMAAAVELAAAGAPVTVYEAARELGGRARVVERYGTRLDNGQHILIGAYTSTLDLMQRVGASPTSLVRKPLRWHFPPHFTLAASPAPAPLHLALGLLSARGMSLAARIRCAAFLHRCKRDNFRLVRDCSVSQLLADAKQDAAAIRYLWDPLCVAALNTPSGEASAQIFLNVLKDGLAAGRAASDVLLPATDLSSLFPNPAADYVMQRGGQVFTGCAVRRITPADGGFRIETSAGRHDSHHAVIVATAPQHVRGLVAHIDALREPIARIDELAYQPIVTVYLQYATPIRLAEPMIGLSGRYGQWLFDRSQFSGQGGLVSVVISAHARSEGMDQDTLAARVRAEIEPLLGTTDAPQWVQVIEEKRATFACIPDVNRPDQRTALAGLFLAGDYTAGDYPATLESAVRSGRICARLALETT